MMTFKQNLRKHRILFGIIALSFSSSSAGQVTYTMQTSNFNATQTVTPSGTYAGAYNNGGGEVATYANGSGNTPGVAIFKTFTDDGSTTGNSRALNVGDRFSITAYVGNSTSFWDNSNAGISFNNGSSNSNFSDYNSGQRLKMQINKSDNWFPAGQSSGAGYAAPGEDVTFTFTLTSSNTVNVEIDRANTSPQTGATTSELELSGSGTIQSFSIWNQASGGSNNMF